MEYDNTDRGVLFKNDRKEQEKHPDYRGSINVGGVDYWLSAWIKEGNRGKFMSLSVKPKDAPQAEPKNTQRQQAPRHTAPASNLADIDDVPFN